MQMAFASDQFDVTAKPAESSVPDKKVERELLRRAIGDPIKGRLPVLIPVAIICFAASGLSQRITFWMLAACFLLATFLAAATAGRVKGAIERKSPIKKAMVLWLSMEFVATAFWGTLLAPMSESGITGAERATITAVILVTLATACLFASNAKVMSKTAIAGFAATALPISVYHYAEYGLLMIAGAALMFGCLIHLISRKQQEAVQNLRTELENGRLTKQLRKALGTAQYLSSHDSLTGLLNRRDFETTAKKLRQSHSHSSMAIILLDLDHFKKINDRFGHATGDEVLKAAAGIIKTPVRALHMSAGAQEAVARWGGEEFVIALARTSLEEAKIVAERICLALAQYENSNWPPTLKLTCSIGVATWGDGEELNNAIDQADLAMFKAKSLGRNNVQIAGEQTVETLIGPE